MMEARAVVVCLDGDHAWVRVSEQAGGCGRCDEPGGCRSVKLTTVFKSPTETFRLPNAIGARPGDNVRICIDDGAPLRAALASYALAAVLLVGGGALGAMADGGGDMAVLAGAVGGLVLAWLVNRVLLRSRSWRSSLSMVVVGAVPSCGHAADREAGA